MSRAITASNGGNYCGRAVHGVSNLSLEDVRQIEAHRAKDRPTPWAHLAVRFGVNEIDLRQMFGANDNAEAAAPTPRPLPVSSVPRPADMLPPLWRAGLPVKQIAEILCMDDRSVMRLRERLNLPPRKVGHQ